MLLIGSVAATRQSPLVITIEGTIGAGKSTVMQALQKIYATDESVSFVEEPVEKWIAGGPVNLLDAMYTGALAQPTFQLMALSTRVGPVVRALRGSSVVIGERSIWSDRHVFAEIGLVEPATRAAYELAHAALVEALPADLHEVLVLLDVPIDVAMGRIAKRGRPEEASIDAAYLQRLEEGHERLAAACARDARRELLRVDACPASERVVEAVCREVARAIQEHRTRSKEG